MESRASITQRKTIHAINYRSSRHVTKILLGGISKYKNFYIIFYIYSARPCVCVIINGINRVVCNNKLLLCIITKMID